MIHTRNTALIHFKQSKLSAKYIIDTNTFQTVKTIFRIHNRSAKKGVGLF